MPLDLGALGSFFGAAGGSALQSGLAIYESNQARKFAKEMRKTAYQTTMRDMRRAGLNPILAARVGPTPMPGVPAAPVWGNAVQAGLEGAASAAGTGLDVQKTATEEQETGIRGTRSAREKTQHDIDKLNRTIATTNAETAVHARNEMKMRALKTQAEANAAELRNIELRAQQGRWNAQAEYFNSSAGQLGEKIRLGSEALGGFRDIVPTPGNLFRVPRTPRIKGVSPRGNQQTREW